MRILTIFFAMLAFYACEDNTLQNAPPPDDSTSLYITIARNWTGSYSTSFTPNYNYRCYVDITNNNNIYSIRMKPNEHNLEWDFNGDYKCSVYSGSINWRHYILTDLATNDTLYINYDASEQVVDGIIQSFSLVNDKKDERIFCFND